MSCSATKRLAAADGFGIAEQEEDLAAGLRVPAATLRISRSSSSMGAVSRVDTGREQQVDAVAGADRRDFQRALGQPGAGGCRRR